MALKKSEKRLLIILGVAVSYFLIDRFVLSAGKENETAPMVTQGTATNPNSGLSNLASPTEVVISGSESRMEEFDDWGRDPFSLTDYGNNSGSGRATPTLKGIFWIKDKPFVLINHLILSEGEEVEGVRVESISNEEVLCYQGSQLFTLHWRE